MVLKAPSTPQNTVTQLRIAPDSLETPPWNISPNKETSINSEARRALDFEDATQQVTIIMKMSITKQLKSKETWET
ncbi:hypothetical protein NC652_008067 [Populus alba x Populus x berolinensis]|nr:hypothetical protein NC652_008067 [Populus alba x Populus x berolinensis]